MQHLRSSLASKSNGVLRNHGVVKCAMCGSFAGDYLRRPKTVPCGRCLRGVPLCELCIEGNCNDATKLETSCFACGQVVCSESSCSQRCADEECKALYCSECEDKLPECSSCFMLHCQGTGHAEFDCLLACEGTSGCKEMVCRLCQETRCTCEACHATVCERCRKECPNCWTVLCPGCEKFLVLPVFCESCKADRCLLCLMRMKPCEVCGQPIELERVRKAMIEVKGFIQKWASSGLGRGDKGFSTRWKQSLEVRAEVANRWKAFIDRYDPSKIARFSATVPAANITSATATLTKAVDVLRPAPWGVDGGKSSGDSLAVRPSTSTGTTVGSSFWISSAFSSGVPPSAFPTTLAAPPSVGGGGVGGVRILGSEAGVTVTGLGMDARGRVPVEVVRRFMSQTTGTPPERSTSVEEIKKFFAGWVDSDVVDMYFDSTGDIPQTVELCGAQMVELCGAQTVEHCLVGVSDTSSGNLLRPPEPEVGGASAIVLPPGFGETPSPGAAAIVGAMLGHSSPTIVRPPPGFAGAPAQAQEKAVTVGHPPVERRDIVGDSHLAESGSRVATGTTNVTDPQAFASQPTVTSGNRPRAATEVRMGQVNSNAPGRGEDEAVFTTATDATDSSTSNMTAKEKCATDNNQGMAEWEKLADAPTIALPHSEMLAMQAGKGTRRAGTGTGIGMCSSENFPGETVEMAEQPEDQKDERHNKKAKMKEGEVETPQAADQGNTNATVEDWSPRFKAKTSSVGGEEKAVGAAAAAPASATMGGRGPLFVPGMTLEEKLNKAMALKDLDGVRAVLKEASETTGTQKIKKQCRKWINKREGQLKAAEDERKKQEGVQAIPSELGGPHAQRIGMGKSLVEIFCPPNMAPQLIGKSGVNIKSMKRKSEASISIKEYERGVYDVVITGAPKNVETATQLVENFFRSKQCDPSSLPPPNSTRAGVGIDGRVGGGGRGGGGGGAGGRARLPAPAVSAETKVGRLVPGRPLPAQTAEMSTSGHYTQAAGILTTARNAPSVGISTAGESKPSRGSKSGSESGGGVGGGSGGVVSDGPWGGELRNVLKTAGCEKHFERFKKDQIDLESLQLMEEKDFEQMGVTRGEANRIKNAVTTEEVPDSGLDPDHPLTCKICLDAVVEIMFLPCGHQSTCEGCGKDYVGKSCIICRVMVEVAQKTIRGP